MARAGQGWHTFNRRPDQLAEPLGKLDGLLADQGRSRHDLTITVCPYFQPLDADIAGQYADAGVDAVAALFLAFSADDVQVHASTPCSRCSTGPRPPEWPGLGGAAQPPMATGRDSMPRSTTLVL